MQVELGLNIFQNHIHNRKGSLEGAKMLLNLIKRCHRTGEDERPDMVRGLPNILVVKLEQSRSTINNDQLSAEPKRQEQGLDTLPEKRNST